MRSVCAFLLCVLFAPAASSPAGSGADAVDRMKVGSKRPHLRGGELEEAENALFDDAVALDELLDDLTGTGADITYAEERMLSFPKLSFPFPPNVDSGVTFSRSIHEIDGGSKFHLAFGPGGSSGHCKSSDTYGDNQCHYSWGDSLEATYELQLETELEEGDTIEGEFKIDLVVPWSFSCKVCGEDCTLVAPVINQRWSFPMDPCPIPVQSVTNTIGTVLQGNSPVEGITTHAQGKFQLKKKSGEAVAAFSVDVFVK